MQSRPVARLAWVPGWARSGAGSPSGPARPCLPRTPWAAILTQRNRANKALGRELGSDLTEYVCRLPALLGPLNKLSSTVCLVALLTQFPPPRQVAQRPFRHCSAWLFPLAPATTPPCRGSLSLFPFGKGGRGYPEESGNQLTQVWYFIFKQASFALVGIFS